MKFHTTKQYYIVFSLSTFCRKKGLKDATIQTRLRKKKKPILHDNSTTGILSIIIDTIDNEDKFYRYYR